MSDLICHACGTRYGQHQRLSTYHAGTCAWCGEDRPVTESRDYGYPERPLVDHGYPPRDAQ